MGVPGGGGGAPPSAWLKHLCPSPFFVGVKLPPPPPVSCCQGRDPGGGGGGVLWVRAPLLGDIQTS